MSKKNQPAPAIAGNAEMPGSLRDYPVGPYPDHVLQAASEQELKSVLAGETKELQALRALGYRALDLAGRRQDLEVRTVQLQNALHKAQSDDFWRAVMLG